MSSPFKGMMTSRPSQKTIDSCEMSRKYVAEANRPPCSLLHRWGETAVRYEGGPAVL